MKQDLNKLNLKFEKEKLSSDDLKQQVDALSKSNSCFCNMDSTSYADLLSEAEAPPLQRVPEKKLKNTDGCPQLAQLKNFGFPFTLNANKITLVSEGDFLEPQVLTTAVKKLIKAFQSETSLSDVTNNVVESLTRKFIAPAWFCQIVP